MTLEEAIEIIKVERACVKINTDNKCDRDCINCDLLRTEEEIFAAYDMAIEALEKAEKFKWIPLSERLPESYKPVLVQWSKIYPAEVLKCTWIDIGYVNSSCKFERNKGFGVIDGTVEAWMPLPEPYKEGDE